MRRSVTYLTLLCLLMGSLSANSVAATKRSIDRGRPSLRQAFKARSEMPLASSSLIVEFEEDAAPAEVREAVEDVGGEVEADLSELGRVKVVDVENGTTTAATEELLQDPAVEAVEPDTIRRSLSTPDDPLFDQQWALHNQGQSHPIADPFAGITKHAGKVDADVDADKAWDVEDGSSDPPIIAVLDQGFDISHPDIANSRWTNPYEVAGNGEDDDLNGYVDDTRGWDFTGTGDPNPDDPGDTGDSGHGTHVAAIATGVANNSTGIAGVCPGCQLLPLRFGLTLKQELEAIDYLIGLLDAHPELEIQVLNLSFGSWEWSGLERRALSRLGEHGVLTVAAAGNGGLDNDMFDWTDIDGDGLLDDASPLYPASYELDKIISVAASNDLDQLGYFTGCDVQPRASRDECMFSNWGRTSVDVAAPGTDIKSAYLSEGGTPRYETWNGTSMASPLVAGIAGLVAAENPSFGPMALKNAIMNSVDTPRSLKKVWRRKKADTGSFLRTNGRVNAFAALTASTDEATRLVDGSIAGARPIKTQRRDVVNWPADVNDVYRKWLKKGTKYIATVKADDPDRNVELVVYKPGTKDLWQFENACFGGSGKCSAVQPFEGLDKDGTEWIKFTATRTGNFYFHASSYFVNSPYRIRVVAAR